MPVTTPSNSDHDHMVVRGILLRDQRVTQQFLYVKCYPLFKAVFDNYYTDCQNCQEFINELYIHLLTPDRQTKLCKLQTFRFGCTLTTWLKTVAVYYCYQRYRRKKKVTFISEKSTPDDNSGDRFDLYASSMYEEQSPAATSDAETILCLMPNRRYSMLIRLRYIDGRTNEETAAALGMKMDTYYAKHLRAKKQFYDTMKREAHDGTLL